jgi:predicted nucleotidyltransferase
MNGTIAAVEKTYTTPVLDKLGVRPGMRIAIVGAIDPDGTFRELLSARTSDITVGGAGPDTDLVFLAADSVAELDALAALRSRIRPNGAIWVVSRKGKAATLRDVEVIDAAKAVGLVDNKVVSFSPTHTALRLVIPIARRAERAPR